MLRRLCVLPLVALLLVLTPAALSAQEAPAEPAWAPYVRAEAAAAVDGLPDRFQAAHADEAIAAWWSRLPGYLAGVWYSQVAANEQAAREAAEQARARRRPSNAPSGARSGCANSAGVPEGIVWRESRCQWDAYNDGGCGGRGCIGAFQIDAGHYAADSPWNATPGVHGTCYGLGDPWDPAVQQACASRLSPSAWNL